MNSETGGIWNLIFYFEEFFQLLSSETTNSMVVLNKIAVKIILIDKIIILLFLTPLEAVIILIFWNR
ncbi:hypothetical protein BK008_10345 [Methanobacterium sp. MZ-A1]|uniref:Uncharacterized protein n=1 Tax=Methanobacterium subterraneum TaxID=59277 RepID=A0A2H4VED5_9EURY|nr:hypothetical protein BK007_10845 [Methanobacterium subterraneum]AUB58671.1 hypothetical protein BK008_10345 [Methanobacterium sp. MZ-A1]